MRVILGMFAFALFLACTVCVAEVVEHFPCDQDGKDQRDQLIDQLFTNVLSASSNSTCVVHEVRIDPCAEASEKQPCKIKRGRSAIIAFDYTSGNSLNIYVHLRTHLTQMYPQNCRFRCWQRFGTGLLGIGRGWSALRWNEYRCLSAYHLSAEGTHSPDIHLQFPDGQKVPSCKLRSL